MSKTSMDAILIERHFFLPQRMKSFETGYLYKQQSREIPQGI